MCIVPPMKENIHILNIKDMAGLLTPTSAQLLVSALRKVKQLIVDYTKLRRFTKKYKKQKKRFFGCRLGFKIFRLGLRNTRFKGLRFSD